jgi:hypothetical protein
LPSLGIRRPLTFHILSSPLKPFRQMNWNLEGSNYGRSSKKFAHFFPIHIWIKKLHKKKL